MHKVFQITKNKTNMTYEIYIKGKADGNVASCGVVVLKDGKQIFSNGKVFEEYIRTKDEIIPLIEYKSQFQMELYALAWGLTYCEDNNEVKVYSNVLAVVGWVNKWEVPEDYESVFDYCRYWGEKNTITAYHVKKGTNDWMDIADTEATFYNQEKT